MVLKGVLCLGGSHSSANASSSGNGARDKIMKLIWSRGVKYIVLEEGWRNAGGGNTTFVDDDVLGSSLVLGGDDLLHTGMEKQKNCTKSTEFNKLAMVIETQISSRLAKSNPLYCW